MKKEVVQPTKLYTVKRIEVTTVEGVIRATSAAEAMKQLREGNEFFKVHQLENDMKCEVHPVSGKDINKKSNVSDGS